MQQSDLDLMRMGIEYRFPVQLRSYSFQCRPLTTIELTEVAIETANDLKKKSHLQHVPMAENVLYAIKTLSRASTSAPGATDVTLHEYVLQQLTPDELMFLFKEYNAIVDRINPSLENINEERLQELLNLAKKNPGALIEYSFAELVGLCRSLIRTTLQTDSSSGG